MQKRLAEIKSQGRPPIPSQSVAEVDGSAVTEQDEREESEREEPERSRSIIFRNVEEKRMQSKQPSSPKIAKGATSFRLPSPDLLRPAPRHEKIEEDELKECAHAIEQKCQEFDVSGRVTQINPGPVVTTYEFKPEAGIKYSRITGLADDLCLALKAESILIERIPGKSTVGIEVPNANRQTIALREQIESAEFVNSPSKLTLALGKDLIGRNRVSDLCQMPHLLIAGSTGTGKSVFLNSLILSMLYKGTPDELKMVMIDPKRLELGLYEDIPHLLAPVVTDPKVASNVLRNATREMESRLKLLAARGVRNIDQYNRTFQKGQSLSLFDETENAEHKPLPYIVIVIDELADLMMVDTSNVEESITRLAQMARAVGIHLILATQRPSVDVITGLIKANFPARISFRVASKVDSRTILDANGAESLLGRGDMLVLARGFRAPQPHARPLRHGRRNLRRVRSLALAGQGRLQRALARSPERRKRRRPRWRAGRRSRRRRSLPGSRSRRLRSGPRIHFHVAAPPAHRLRPRRAPDRHHGKRRHRRPARRHQAARSPESKRLDARGRSVAALESGSWLSEVGNSMPAVGN